MDLTVAMKSKKGPLFTMAMSFNNKGPFGGFYRYIGEEETYKVYRDSMTDSEGKEVPLDNVPGLRSSGRRVRQRDREGRRAGVERGELRADDGAARQDRRAMGGLAEPSWQGRLLASESSRPSRLKE